MLDAFLTCRRMPVKRTGRKEKCMTATKCVLLTFFSLSILFLFTPAAHAQADGCGERCIENPTDGFNGWENLEPTGYQPPTITACTAFSNNNQRCRSCEDTYFPNGQPTGNQVCAYVARAASCKCNVNVICYSEGSCKYL